MQKDAKMTQDDKKTGKLDSNLGWEKQALTKWMKYLVTQETTSGLETWVSNPEGQCYCENVFYNF